MKCAHRKLRIRPKGDKFRAFCVACEEEGADHETITEAYLAFRSDLQDAAALKALKTHEAHA